MLSTSPSRPLPPPPLSEDEYGTSSPITPIDTRRPSEAASIDTVTTSATSAKIPAFLRDNDQQQRSNVNSKSIQVAHFYPLPTSGSIEIYPIHSRSDSSITLSHTNISTDSLSRISCDTDLDTFAGDVPPLSASVSEGTQEKSRQSIFLRMQQKREEQRKSIYAYRQNNQLQQPMVYPAILSIVARELYRRLSTSTIKKDDIEYHDVFRGKDAVVSCLQDRQHGSLTRG